MQTCASNLFYGCLTSLPDKNVATKATNIYDIKRCAHRYKALDYKMSAVNDGTSMMEGAMMLLENIGVRMKITKPDCRTDSAEFITSTAL